MATFVRSDTQETIPDEELLTDQDFNEHTTHQLFLKDKRRFWLYDTYPLFNGDLLKVYFNHFHNRFIHTVQKSSP